MPQRKASLSLIKDRRPSRDFIFPVYILMHDISNFPAVMQSLNLVRILPHPNSITVFTKARVTLRSARVVPLISRTPNQTSNSVPSQLQAATSLSRDGDPLHVQHIALHVLYLKIQANKKVNFILEEAMKAQTGSRDTTPSLTSALDGQRHASAALPPPGNRPGTVQ
jgi:hypothetical protein